MIKLSWTYWWICQVISTSIESFFWNSFIIVSSSFFIINSTLSFYKYDAEPFQLTYFVRLYRGRKIVALRKPSRIMKPFDLIFSLRVYRYKLIKHSTANCFNLLPRALALLINSISSSNWAISWFLSCWLLMHF